MPYPITLPGTGEPAVFCPYCNNIMRIETMHDDSPSRAPVFLYHCPQCKATTPRAASAEKAAFRAIQQPMARLLTFSELWYINSFWLETRHAERTMLAPDAMYWSREKVMDEKPFALLLYSGMTRSVDLFHIQWRAWSAKPQDFQMEHVAWMNRKERDAWLQATQDETWKAVSSK